MIVNEMLADIKQAIFKRELGKAIAALENYLLTYPQQHEREQLLDIKTDYQLMADYWRRGFDDPQREQLYSQLLRRMYVLTANVDTRYAIRNNSFTMSVYSRTRNSRRDWSVTTLRHDMESFVSDVAMLDLQPEATRADSERTVFMNHQLLMSDLFDYIWTSRQWSDPLVQAFEEILLSPTVDSHDQQLIIAAVMLSAMNMFDFNKLRLMMTVYRKATDDVVRMRALVGWVLALSDEVLPVYPEVADMVGQTVAEERCRHELLELQMQLVYCMKAESDNDKIQHEIMPELLKNNNLRVTRNGIEEIEDEEMEDILHPEAAEQRMERLEKSMQQMADMQRGGSDIYFGGFSQMKRFRFFDNVSNWFVPFYPQHPDITNIWTRVKAKRFLREMMKNGPFCDSDKYSFVLVFEQVLGKLPQNVVDMLDKGEATLAGADIMFEETKSAAYLRRLYLQNLYRFFRLYHSRSHFCNPFTRDKKPGYLFFARRVFKGTALEEHFDELGAFLMKQGMVEETMAVLENYSEVQRRQNYYVTLGQALLRMQGVATGWFGTFNGLSAMNSFEQALLLQPDDKRALAGYARAAFSEHNYQGAADAYGKLVAKNPERVGYQLNMAVCLTHLHQYDDAEKILYKLNYEQPDNDNVSRVLAWTLLCNGKCTQAEHVFERLMGSDTHEPDDFVNYGFCLWFKGDIAGAANMFGMVNLHEVESGGQKADDRSWEKVFADEQELIHSQGISDTEIQLMIDAITATA